MNGLTIMAGVILVLYVASVRGFSIYYRRRFGRSGHFLDDSASNSVQRYLGLCEYLIMVYYLVAYINLYTGYDFSGLISTIHVLDHSVIFTIGLAGTFAFLVLMFAARLNLGASWRLVMDTKTDDELVSQGFYRFMRNPYFTFLLGFQLSVFAVLPNTITLLALVQSWILTGLQVRYEEVYMEEKYGQEYLKYKAKTGRFLPGI